MILGFTGTRRGLSEKQRDQLCFVLSALRTRVNEFHHGGAVGADQEAMTMARQLRYVIHWHPSTLNDLTYDRDYADDVWHDTWPPLVRNRHIVEACDMLVAAPLVDKEELRSGTWATVRYARQAVKPYVMLSRGEN